MISKRIISSAKFLQMPLEAQALYFHLTINADDDGVAEAYPITKLLGTPPDVIKILLAKEFIRQLNEDQVVLINNWTEHNIIRADRKVNSIYKNLLPDDIKLIEAKPRSDVKDNSKRVGGQSTDGISKDKLSKVKIRKVNSISANADEENYIFTKKLNKLLTDKKKHIRIIGLFIKAKEYTPANNSELQAIIKRNVKVAVSLSHYSIEKIIKTLKYLKDNADFKWTLESVGKYIDENLDNLSTNKMAECHL